MISDEDDEDLYTRDPDDPDDRDEAWDPDDDLYLWNDGEDPLARRLPGESRLLLPNRSDDIPF